ncbi:MAG: endonuclease III [Clostridia bacterium]|nr:endonuclease III [Clostridia bacterium]
MESLAKKKERVEKIIDVFEKVYGDADCTLDYSSALELLIATQLAAQCTDARVNLTTPALFKKYPDVYAFAYANELELREMIKSCGFYKNKAKNIIGCCQKLISDFGGEVPSTMDELLSLPGVGRKTANLVLGDIFGIPGIVVDTHATRLSNRFGLTTHKDPYKIELDLMKVVPKDKWSWFCHCLVEHGRAYCKAQKPDCQNCPMAEFCPTYNK